MHLATRLSRWFNVREQEAPAVAASVLMFFLLFAGYFMLRPVRETMGVAGGVQQLQWLFTGTFVATVLALPLFGWLASVVRRRRIQAWTYGFFTINLLAFAAALALRPDNPWVARAFYIWLSVFNLLAVSLAWSVLADVFSSDQAKRLFALMASGSSLGGLRNPSFVLRCQARVRNLKGVEHAQVDQLGQFWEFTRDAYISNNSLFAQFSQQFDQARLLQTVSIATMKLH